MKFLSLLRSAAVLGLTLLSATGLAHATLTGVSSDPMGGAWTRGDANTGYVVWDTFPNAGPATQTINVLNDTPDDSFGGSNLLLNQSGTVANAAQGAGIYVVSTSTIANVGETGDVLFAGGNNVNFTLSGSATFTIHGLTLQIKRPGNLVGVEGVLIPTLSINGASGVVYDSITNRSGTGNTSSSTNGNWAVTTFYWGPSLFSTSGASDFLISFGATAFQRNIDTVAVDFATVAPVPEPATCAMLGLGLGALWAVRRRVAKR